MRELEIFFDVSSPWTYLGVVRVRDVIERTGATAVWKPILVGGVFNAVNEGVYEARANPNPVKARYYAKDLQDWARHVGVTIGMPPVFPVRAVAPMRQCLAAQDEGRLEPFALGLFEAYWGRLEDISQPEVLARVAEAAGLSAEKLATAADTPAVKERLRANTRELIDRGGFGSPTLFVNGTDMYFGNDRMELVEAALRR